MRNLAFRGLRLPRLGAMMRSGGFSPETLFTGGADGAWFDPSDPSTLFKDSAGTTPVTTAGQPVGQPVGLMLDKSKGLVRGPELVTNGDFTTDTDWLGISGGTNLTIAGGQATFTISASYRGAFQIADYAPGTWLEIMFDLVSVSAGNVQFVGKTSDNGTAGGTSFSLNASSSGSYKAIVLISSNVNSIAIRNTASGSTTVIDNVSVRELPGNHATQATAAARPIYQTAPDRVTINGVDDRMTVTVPVGGFTGTMVLATDQGTASYGVTIPAGAYEIGGRGGLYFPGNAIVGQLIRNGALSEGEAAATEAYFVEKGATASYGAVTDFSNFWRDWLELTSFPANAFDNVQGGDFTDAFTNTALTQTSIDNILVSLVASGIAAGTRVFDQSGGSAPSSTGEAAIDTLRSRGWTVTVTGGY